MDYTKKYALKGNALKAFKELKRLGNIEVMESEEYNAYGECRGYFWIWCEGETCATHLDYYASRDRDWETLPSRYKRVNP